MIYKLNELLLLIKRQFLSVPLQGMGKDEDDKVE
jgi:hypothetical protein